MTRLFIGAGMYTLSGQKCGHFFLCNAVQQHQSVSLFHMMLHVPPLWDRAALLPHYKMPEHMYPVEVTPVMPAMDIYYPGLLW